MGVPMIVVAIAENQEAVGASLAKRGAAVYLGRQNSVTPSGLAHTLRDLIDATDRRQSLAKHAATLVDGCGAQRIVSRMWKQLLRMRPAQLHDAELLFSWQQDAQVRRWSFSNGPESFEQHLNWFMQKLVDTESSILICETESGTAVGCVRRDRHGSQEICGLVIDPSFRGRRLASLVLRLAIERWSADDPNKKLDAWIKPENEASRRCFAQAGFVSGGLHSYRGQPAEIWTYRANATRPTGAHFLSGRMLDGLTLPPTSFRSTA
jgi:RimJ/RimL family protein N-acetyltransferase